MTLNDISIEESGMDREMLHYIESILTTPIVTDNIKIKEIDPDAANRWYGNFIGLLSNELYLSSNATYIHLRINNYRLNTDYKGDKNIKLLDSEIFEEIIDTFNRNKAYANSLNN
jgi:hypothetical protein